jgi:hypothetical protein
MTSFSSLTIKQCEFFAHESGHLLDRFWPENCQQAVRIAMAAVRQDYQGFVCFFEEIRPLFKDGRENKKQKVK